MKVDAEPAWTGDLSKSALNSLSLNNQRLERGSDEVLTTPFMASISDPEMESICEEILSSTTLTPKLREIEDDNISKFGPRSIAVPWSERKSSLVDYFRGGELRFSDSSSGRLRPMSEAEASKRLIPSSNSGLPYLQRKKQVVEDALAAGYSDEYPCVLFTRTAEQRKTRNVWGYPIADTIRESRYIYPFLELEKRWEWRSALLGPDAVDIAMKQLLSTRSPGELVVCVDFSAYDASVTPRLAGEAFSYISSFFQDSLEELYTRFVTIPIFTPDGEMSGEHGVPSGSSFTNTVDSIAQWIAAGSPSRCQIQGDDGVYLVNAEGRDQLERRFSDEGLEFNADKSETFETEEAVYLQRYYHPDYSGGVYSVARALNRIKYLEAWTDFDRLGIEGSDFFALRTLMILENVKHHPGFELLVRKVQSLDKNGLSFSQGGLHAYSSALQSKARAGIFNQTDMRSGISDFAVMKVLRAGTGG